MKMKFAEVNVYRARYDLVVRGSVQISDPPVAERVLIAVDLVEAIEMAKAMNTTVYERSVHETMLRDVTLLHADVSIRSTPWEEEK